MADDVVYTVVPMLPALEKMRSWGQLSARMGLTEWYVGAVRHIDGRLRTDPVAWGDPAYDYRGARLKVYRATHENFIAYYAVHLDRPIVFLRNLALLQGSPLIGQV